MIDPTMGDIALELLRRYWISDKWDLAPSVALVAHTGSFGKPTLMPVLLPIQAWEAAHPATVLSSLGKKIDRGEASVSASHPYDHPRELVGTLLIVEAHGISSADLTGTEAEHLDAWKQHHRLEEHPKARECRTITFIDRAHTIGYAQHLRGNSPDERVTYNVEGLIPAAVDQFLTTLECNKEAVTA